MLHGEQHFGATVACVEGPCATTMRHRLIQTLEQLWQDDVVVLPQRRLEVDAPRAAGPPRRSAPLQLIQLLEEASSEMLHGDARVHGAVCGEVDPMHATRGSSSWRAAATGENACVEERLKVTLHKLLGGAGVA